MTNDDQQHERAQTATPRWAYIIHDDRPIMPDAWLTGSDRMAEICEKSDRREVNIIYGW